MELFFCSAFVRLFKYTALSNAYKLADTYQNYRSCFDLAELLCFQGEFLRTYENENMLGV